MAAEKARETRDDRVKQTTGGKFKRAKSRKAKRMVRKKREKARGRGPTIERAKPLLVLVLRWHEKKRGERERERERANPGRWREVPGGQRNTRSVPHLLHASTCHVIHWSAYFALTKCGGGRRRRRRGTERGRLQVAQALRLSHTTLAEEPAPVPHRKNSSSTATQPATLVAPLLP